MALKSNFSRRDFIKLSAGTVAALSVGACNPFGGGGGRTIKIGYVTPRTGPLAPFGEADNFVLAEVSWLLC